MSTHIRYVAPEIFSPEEALFCCAGWKLPMQRAWSLSASGGCSELPALPRFASAFVEVVLSLEYA